MVSCVTASVYDLHRLFYASFSQSDDDPKPACLAVLGAMREPLGGVGRRADGRVFDVRHAAGLQLRLHRGIQIEVQGTIGSAVEQSGREADTPALTRSITSCPTRYRSALMHGPIPAHRSRGCDPKLSRRASTVAAMTFSATPRQPACASPIALLHRIEERQWAHNRQSAWSTPGRARA